MADGYGMDVALNSGVVAQADKPVDPHASLVLTSDVAERMEAGGDVGTWMAARQPMLAAPLSWQVNDGRHLQPITLSPLGGKGLLRIHAHAVTV